MTRLAHPSRANPRVVGRVRRHRRVRKKVSGTAAVPRLAVYKSNRHIIAQVIDDERGHTLAYASTHEKELVAGLPSTKNLEAARRVGQAIGRRAKEAGVAKVVFDRGGFKYHGRVKAVADAARAEGLEF